MSFLARAILGVLLVVLAGGAGASWQEQPAGASTADRAVPAPVVPPASMTWPRTFEKAGNSVSLYQPQVDSWKDQDKIRFRSAVTVMEAGTGQLHYGVAAVQADTLVDKTARTVFMTNLDIALRFPGVPAAKAEALKALVKECIAGLSYLNISLDQVLACLHGETKVRTAELNMQPPPMFYSETPAIMVVYLGQPQFKPVTGTQLMFAVNTNWVVIMDMNTLQYYLLDGDSWLTASDAVNGPWVAATALPPGLSSLPAGANWDEVRTHVPGSAFSVVPKVFTSTEPAELIVTNGPPEYTPIQGTRLMYVSNPEMPLFLDLADDHYYFLASGRWFVAPGITGPWSAASAILPAEFAKIPEGSPMGFVLASVPGTQEAKDAVLMASVAHKATVKIAEAKIDVTYDGEPKFVPITGTTMTYAVNTSYQVVLAGGSYYCCSRGIWFVAPAATGPWVVCTSVPAVIYTIPPSSPLYNTTYVQVYSATPTTVVVGYTAGYSGEYVAATGALMFGAGMLMGAALSSCSNCWYGCSPCYYSYGCCAHYSYYSGGYYRAGGAYYGPHGGAGWGSAYNPSTGTWARGGYEYGASGAHWGAQAYNPFTNTYGQHTGGTNGYQSWGNTTVSRGDQWTSAGHQTGAHGSTGWAENSSGQWAEGAHSNATNSSVAKTSSGDVYAGHDGNVYKKSDGQWQKYSGNGNWEDTTWNKGQQSQNLQSSSQGEWQNSAQHQSQQAAQNSWKNDWSNSDWKSNWENRSSDGGGSSNGWGQHDTQSGLNKDSWSRDQGSSNAFSSWSSRNGGFGGGGFGRFGGGGFGGGGFGGGGFGRFRR